MTDQKQIPFEHDRSKEQYAIVNQSPGKYRIMCMRGNYNFFINNGKNKYFKSEQDAMDFIESYEKG